MENSLAKIELAGARDCLWRCIVKASGRVFEIAAPRFEIDGRLVEAGLGGVTEVGEPINLPNGVQEHVLRGPLTAATGLSLTMVFRLAPDSPVVRFRYLLESEKPVRMTKAGGVDRLEYLAFSLAGMPNVKEIRLSEFDEALHSYRLTEEVVPETSFTHGLGVMGPILVAQDSDHTVLAAYEHGSQVPDAFLRFELSADRTVRLVARKGNYPAGRPLAPGSPFETIWLQLAAQRCDEREMASRYRAFVLRRLSQTPASRTPYIFYNTWNYQERNKWWNGRKYLDSMNQERILAEIEVAHRMGIEVFVIDTGWYGATGDWRVNPSRFDAALKPVRESLEDNGMKLGLWLSPTQAAVSSGMAQEHGDCRLIRNGVPAKPYPVWETEESYRMCLASRYWEAFAGQMIRMAEELGVTYFKWDAIGQYGCDGDSHVHGASGNSAEERREACAFEQVRYLIRVVEKVCAAHPEIIVDFDITESRRAVGLAFLAAGKYFLINNGPYFANLDFPPPPKGAPGAWTNVFVRPGPARARLCRTPLDYDRWIPSVLFLAHYLPDPPLSSQLGNLASLVLGHNGIWGDLLSLSEESISLFGQVLGMYKKVRGDITESDPARTGHIGGSPEIHEKILARTGRGVVVIFAAAAGEYTYVTQHQAAETSWTSEGVEVHRDNGGRALLHARLEAGGAGLAFFGV